MDNEEAINLMAVAAEQAQVAFDVLGAPWPPDKTRIARAEALFDQSNAGIMDFLEATKGIDKDVFPEFQDFRKEARIALARHARTLRLVKEYLP